MLVPDEQVFAARARWRYRGEARPDFAEPTALGEESVWDYPRPPRLEVVSAWLRIQHGDSVIAETRQGVRVLETAGAPTFYLPPEALTGDLLQPLPGRSLCEWKGLAEHLALEDGEPVAWRYPDTFPEFQSIRGWYAFYPGRIDCFIDAEQVRPQPGGYYGGWVNSDLKGPIKGEPGTEHW